MSKILIPAILIVGGAVIAIMLIQGQNERKDLTLPTNLQTNESPTSITSETVNKEGFTGTVLAGSSSPLLDFNKADYDKALISGKVVFLYFYANWCPVCRVEVPNELYPAFNELTTDRAVGFRVNYNDDQTDANEELLTKQFGITYQHSKVILKNGVVVLKNLESWKKERYLDEIAKAVK